jgi:hypothetical protein
MGSHVLIGFREQALVGGHGYQRKEEALQVLLGNTNKRKDFSC